MELERQASWMQRREEWSSAVDQKLTNIESEVKKQDERTTIIEELRRIEARTADRWTGSDHRKYAEEHFRKDHGK